ncbi:MAG: conserved repeat domain, partial [Planctomycetaceae bacterium]|nr:conserved repeat domain [Planctomycetaceae bacterium]
MRISFWLLNLIPAKSRVSLGLGKPAKRRPRAQECCASLESLESRVVLTMNTPVSMAVGAVAANVQVADVNGDGKQDVIQLNSSVSAVSVTLGNGDGTFQAPVNSAAGGFGTKMAVGDFNHDGKLDLVTNQGSSIDILKGNGDGSFQLPVPYYVGAVANDIDVGDFNDDGFDDVV